MKFLSILAAVSLALAPVIASAGSSGDSTDNGRPISGPLAGRALAQPVPVGVIGAGALLILVGGMIALLSDDDDVAADTITTTVGTNNGTN